MAGDFKKDLGRDVTAIGEFKASSAAMDAGLDDFVAHIGVGVKEHRDDALVYHRRQHAHSIYCHVFDIR
jgi:hypothetical protein